MSCTSTQVASWHRTLYKACGLAAVPPSVNDLRNWFDAMTELNTLAETEGGPFCEADIIAAVSLMKKEKRKGNAGWSLRPTNIIRDPFTFKDIILQARATLATVKRPAEPAHTPQLIQEDLTPGGSLTLEEARERFRQMREGGPV